MTDTVKAWQCIGCGRAEATLAAFRGEAQALLAELRTSVAAH